MTIETLPQLIERIEGLDAKATREFKPVYSQHCGHLRNEANYQISYKDEWPETDKAFIAAARTLLPACARLIAILNGYASANAFSPHVYADMQARIAAELAKLAISDETRAE